MHLLLAAESSGGLAALGLNWGAFIFQLINFGVLFLVLKKWVFPPVLALLERRRSQIEAGLKDAETAKQALASAQTERSKLLSAARKEADDLVEAARSEASKEAVRIVTDAKTAADATVSQAEARIERERREARTELMSELGGIVAAATAAVTRQQVTPKADAEVIERALQEAGK